MGLLDILKKGKKYLDEKQEKINEKADKYRERNYSTRRLIELYLKGSQNISIVEFGSAKTVLLERGFSEQELAEIRHFSIDNGISKTLSQYRDLINNYSY